MDAASTSSLLRSTRRTKLGLFMGASDAGRDARQIVRESQSAFEAHRSQLTRWQRRAVVTYVS
eukprot:5845444-Prorocentrum_lima.AAC.1